MNAMRSSSRIIPPGATLGMLGGGQLGRMALLAGRRLGYRFQVYDPAAKCCAASVAEKTFTAPWEDRRALAAFARGIAAATLEFENIPAETLEALARRVPVRPGARVLEICQNRRREKKFLRRQGLPHAEFALAESAAGLERAVATVGFPCVLKTAAFGYDGKGQMKLTAAPKGGAKAWADLWEKLGGAALVVEKWIRFEAECSVIVARGADGATAVFPMAENEHRNHILHRSIAPARLPARAQREGAALAREIAEALGVVGLLAVEMFYADGQLLVNELAPRPHNSGHYSFDACATSQFEQQIRCTAGLPLGATDLLRPAVMINLLGDLWKDGQAPDWGRLLRDPRVKLHLYDKGEPRPGRKMGHFTVMDENPKTAVKVADGLFEELDRG
ncbi:MAG: 5-(carboxyamino)imidazole ribonucleotide synthase [Opitutales bacterium]|jgi:5-(carboxyamino)imidazole ribonucleotide synthase